MAVFFFLILIHFKLFIHCIYDVKGKGTEKEGREEENLHMLHHSPHAVWLPGLDWAKASVQELNLESSLWGTRIQLFQPSPAVSQSVCWQSAGIGGLARLNPGIPTWDTNISNGALTTRLDVCPQRTSLVCASQAASSAPLRCFYVREPSEISVNCILPPLVWGTWGSVILGSHVML